MIQLLNTNLYVGNLQDLTQTNETDWAFVHATQTIHYKNMGWDRKINKPDKTSPYYIKYEKDNHLSLNWVDGAAILYNWSGPETFIAILDFIDKHISTKKVLVHCDQGHSRGPTVGLLYLAKRTNLLSKDSTEAFTKFATLYPEHKILGIAEYVISYWNDIH